MRYEGKMFNKRLFGRLKVLIVFFVICFSVLTVRLFYLQVVRYDEYRQKSDDNIISKTPLKAERGVIYDRNMVPLAVNVTSWRVFVTPRDLKSDDEAALIARGMKDILGCDYETVLNGVKNRTVRDRTVQKSVSEDQKNAVTGFIVDNGLSHVLHTEAISARHYPLGEVGCHVIGFMGSESGVSGIEAYYDAYLKGEDGYYISKKNAAGQAIENSYESYVKATPGSDVILTIDVTLQKILEEQLKATYIDSKADNRVTGIVTDPQTGEILAMATYPSFDLNEPYKLDSDSQKALSELGLRIGSAEYLKAFNEALFKMWNNKAVSALYEPGSTFKIVTTSVALETGVSRAEEGFFCSGALKVEGYGPPIRCHKRIGHGSLNFTLGLQNSCNPVMMTLAQRIGNQRFMDYFIKFGYTGKTGIDLPGEALGIFHSREGFNTVELAVYSFGQTFKTTAIQQINAVSAVANGGQLLQPYVVSKIIDAKGEIVYFKTRTVKERVLGEDVCAQICDILEGGVSGDGGAKNAAVSGYKIAAKTGTSQVRDIRDEHGNSYLYVGSCVGFAPSDGAKLAAIIVVDHPKSNIYYGSAVAAPYIGEFFSQALPYIGVEREMTSDQEQSFEVFGCSGKRVADVIKRLNSDSIEYRIVGNGDKVTHQTPSEGEIINKKYGLVILYTDGDTAEDEAVPSVVGKNADEAIEMLTDKGFNVRITGVSDFGKSVCATVIEQSHEKEKLKVGSVVEIRLRYLDIMD